MLGEKVSMAIRVERVAKPSKIQWDRTKLDEERKSFMFP
jgi:hypothetical protein